MSTGDGRRAELKRFLMERRARLLPTDVGLASLGRRRVPGLRREEVAELVGVTPQWYMMFEMGIGGRRFSWAFVERVAEALRLDGRDRAALYRLALPEVGAATALLEKSAEDGLLESVRAIRDLVRRLGCAGSVEE